MNAYCICVTLFSLITGGPMGYGIAAQQQQPQQQQNRTYQSVPPPAAAPPQINKPAPRNDVPPPNRARYVCSRYSIYPASILCLFDKRIKHSEIPECVID